MSAGYVSLMDTDVSEMCVDVFCWHPHRRSPKKDNKKSKCTEKMRSRLCACRENDVIFLFSLDKKDILSRIIT